jgi:hypothetical protein
MPPPQSIFRIGGGAIALLAVVMIVSRRRRATSISILQGMIYAVVLASRVMKTLQLKRRIVSKDSSFHRKYGMMFSHLFSMVHRILSAKIVAMSHIMIMVIMVIMVIIMSVAMSPRVKVVSSLRNRRSQSQLLNYIQQHHHRRPQH